MRNKYLKLLLALLVMSAAVCSNCGAYDEDGTMGSADMDTFEDEDATTEDRTLVPNEYEGRSGGDGVALVEEVKLGSSGDDED